MNPRPFLRLALIVAAFAQLSCASTGLTPMPHSQPAERIALAPEYRIFYDALKDDGDWVYIQQFGYVFRPDVNFITWRPYNDGFWAPTDLYGWVWISTEPFGWATYHYGQWLYDRYYGWVWEPGLIWGPAWVAWETAGDYAGWSPLLVPSAAADDIRGGAWVYAPLSALGRTDLPSLVQQESDLRDKLNEPKRVENFVERDGVVFNKGPKFDLVEKRAGGSLARVKIDAPVVKAAPRPGASSQPAGTAASSTPTAAETAEATRRAAQEAALVARGLVERGGRPPGTVTVIRPPIVAAESRPAAPAKAPERGRAEAEKGAPADSVKR